MNPKVVVADDQHRTSQELVSLLEREFLVLAAIQDGQTPVDYLRQHRPDVVVLVDRDDPERFRVPSGA